MPRMHSFLSVLLAAMLVAVPVSAEDAEETDISVDIPLNLTGLSKQISQFGVLLTIGGNPQEAAPGGPLNYTDFAFGKKYFAVGDEYDGSGKFDQTLHIEIDLDQVSDEGGGDGPLPSGGRAPNINDINPEFLTHYKISIILENSRTGEWQYYNPQAADNGENPAAWYRLKSSENLETWLPIPNAE